MAEMTMADRFRASRPADGMYETTYEMLDLVLAVDPKAYSQIHCKIAIHFADGSLHEMDGLMPYEEGKIPFVPVATMARAEKKRGG